MPQYPNLDPSAFELPLRKVQDAVAASPTARDAVAASPTARDAVAASPTARDAVAAGGPAGCLLIHGFTGSAVEMRPMGDYLAARGLTVSAPLLPGHGTTWQDLNHTTWQDWYGHVEGAFADLRAKCEKVFVVGFSLGSLLALHLAAHQDMAGLAVLSPALLVRDWRVHLTPLLRYLIKAMPKDPDPAHSDLTDKEALKGFWSYDVNPVSAAYQLYLLQNVVRPELGRIRTPALIIYATRDMAIHPQSGPTLYREIGSPDKEQLVLHNSGHGLVLDVERQTVFQKVYEWVAAH
jgi:carboxylesterase